jgi:hypothetical protein
MPFLENGPVWNAKYSAKNDPNSRENLPLKGQKHEIFDLLFITSNEHTWAPDSYPKIFSNSSTTSTRYSNSKFD